MIPSTLPINMYIEGLKIWQWAIPEKEIQPIILTTFGDWIYQTRNNGLQMLSIMDATVTKIAESVDDLSNKINNKSNREEWFLEGFIIRCNNENREFSIGQCLGWKLQPIIGGKFEYGNIGVYDYKIYWNIASQIIKQVHGIPI